MPRDAIVVVKRGPDGALAVGSDDTSCVGNCSPGQVADTIGAGDVFNAAFLAALANDQTLGTSLAAGVRVASKAISTIPRRYDGEDTRTPPEEAP